MIELKGITKNYYLNKTNVINVLKGIDIKFRNNEFVSILGPSGCGKTTLLNIIGGLDISEGGAIYIDGVSTKEYTADDWDNYRNKRIGFVFQSYNLIPHLNVLSNVCMPLILAGMKKSECIDRAKEALGQVGLEEHIYKKPLQLSGGQMQRVAIARALITDPDIILADEPTGALDSESSVQVMDLLKKVSQDRLIVMVTHNNTLAYEYSSRIINLSGGVVSGDTNPYNGEESATLSTETQSVEETPTIDKTQAVDGTQKVENKEESESVNEAEVADEATTEVSLKNTTATKKSRKRKKEKRSHLGFKTAFSLSARTLLSKKIRTALTSFAGSIGILGIILVLAFSSGVNAYISNLEKGALSIYPLTIEKSSFNINTLIETFLTSSGNGEREEFPKTDEIYVNNVMGNIISDVLGSIVSSNKNKNDLGNFKAYIEKNFDNDLGYVKYNYGLTINVYAVDNKDDTRYMKVEPFRDVMDNALSTIPLIPDSLKGKIETYTQQLSAWSEMLNDQELLDSQYEIIGKGKWPANKVYTENGKYYTDVVMVLDNTNSLNDYELLLLGLKSEKDLVDAFDPDNGFSKEVYRVSDVVGMEYRILTGSDYFEKVDDKWVATEKSIQDREFIDNNTAVHARISAVVRPRKGAAGASIGTKIGYTEALTKFLIDYTENSDIAVEQKQAFQESETSVISGAKLTEAQYNSFMKNEVGIADFTNPVSVSIYANSFESKNKIKEFIKEYNDKTGSELDPNDTLQTLISFVNTMSDTIAKVLVGFCAISLIVSSIMIAVIIYTSVLERRKEVGILRSIGARKSDIVVIFMIESGLLGLLSGIIGFFVGWLLTVPSNILLKNAIGISNLAVVEWWHAVSMILISFGLSIIAGIIPAFVGAKQDPAVSLRTE